MMIRFWSNGTSAAPISTPEVAAGDHHCVGLAHDLVERRDRLGLLDLRDHVSGGARRLDQRAQRLDVRRGAHERQRDVVDAELERPRQVVEVLPRQRRNRQRNARHVDALVRLYVPGYDDRAAGAPALDALDAQLHVAVVDEHVVARLEHAAEHRRAHGQVAVADGVLAGDDDTLPRARGRLGGRCRRSRSFGPCRSAMSAIGRAARSCPSRISRARSACSSSSRARGSAARRPCRARSAPRSTSGDDDAGPIVATIFVRRAWDHDRSLGAGLAPASRCAPLRAGTRPNRGTRRRRQAPPRSAAAGCTSPPGRSGTGRPS